MKNVVYLTALGRAYARSGLEAGADILRLVTAVNAASDALGWTASAVARYERPRIFTAAVEAMPAAVHAPTGLFARGLSGLKARLDLAGIVRAYKAKLQEYTDELETADMFHAWDAAAVLALKGLDSPAIKAKPLLFTPEAGYSGARPKWLDGLRREALSQAAALVLSGECACAELEAEYRHGKKCFTLPRGLEDFKYLRKSRIRAELGAKDRDTLVCSFGRLEPEKGFAVLIDAMALAVKKMPDSVYCAIAGAGPDEQPLKERIRKAGLESRVKLLGFRRDAGDLLADAEIFVSPAVRTVSDQGLLEAMRAGLAIIASDAGCNPESLGWGQAGLLVPPGNPAALAAAILSVASSPKELVYLSARSREHYTKHHTLKATAAAAAGLYNGIAERNPGCR
ncbi:MAG TPA: hypothetical protein DCZ93_08220 [Elusimicrobia bacterium]|nr:hypothetical protein [Elusimicrobiota bacterium]